MGQPPLETASSSSWWRSRWPAPLRGLATLSLALLVVGSLVASPFDHRAFIVTLFTVGLAVSATRPGLSPACLMVATPLGVWAPQVWSVELPALEMLAAGCAIGCVLSGFSAERERSPWVAADVCLALLAAAIVSSGLGSPPRAEWAHHVLFWTSLATIFHIARPHLERSTARYAFLYAVAISALIEATFAVIQFVQGSANRFSRLGGAIVYPQPDGTLDHPNALAPYLVLSALLLAGTALGARGVIRTGSAAAALAAAVGSVLAFSRGGWISLIAGITAFSALQRQRRILAGTVAGLAALLGLTVAFGGTFGARLSSLVTHRFSDLYGFRLTLAERALRIIAHHPLTGTGRFHETGNYAGRPTLATHPHDLLLGVAVFFGVPAALAFLSLIVLAVRGALTGVRSTRVRVRAEAAGAFCALAALVVDGFFEYPFWNDALAVQTVTLVLFAVALGRAATGEAASGSVAPPS